jgi:hypothetical protein
MQLISNGFKNIKGNYPFLQQDLSLAHVAPFLQHSLLS